MQFCNYTFFEGLDFIFFNAIERYDKNAFRLKASEKMLELGTELKID